MHVAGILAEWCDSFRFRYDPDSPADVGLARELWRHPQRSRAAYYGDPEFAWTAPVDPRGGSGVAGYAVYWGTQPEGTATTYVITTTFNPKAVASPGTLPSAAAPRDAVGNWGNWRTAFTFRYDATQPGAPGPAIDQNGAPSNRWQRFINDPDFIWPEATDQPTGAGVTGYYPIGVRSPMGPARVGPRSQPTTPPARHRQPSHRFPPLPRRRTPPAISATGRPFSPSSTMPACPGTARNVTELSGSVNGRWQILRGSPACFAWTAAADLVFGVAGYYVYLGPNSTGIGARWVTTTTFNAGRCSPPQPPILLRLQARDAAGPRQLGHTFHLPRLWHAAGAAHHCDTGRRTSSRQLVQ